MITIETMWYLRSSQPELKLLLAFNEWILGMPSTVSIGDHLRDVKKCEHNANVKHKVSSFAAQCIDSISRTKNMRQDVASGIYFY